MGKQFGIEKCATLIKKSQKIQTTVEYTDCTCAEGRTSPTSGLVGRSCVSQQRDKTLPQRVVQSAGTEECTGCISAER